MTVQGMRWTCPRCQRSFGRANRPHTCLPAIAVDAYFAGRPPAQRRIYDAVAAHVRELDGVAIEAVSVGVLFKASRTFAELRPGRDGLVLSVLLPRLLASPRVRRTVPTGSRGAAHFILLHDAADVDAELRAWLTEAYFSVATEENGVLQRAMIARRRPRRSPEATRPCMNAST